MPDWPLEFPSWSVPIIGAIILTQAILILVALLLAFRAGQIARAEGSPEMIAGRAAPGEPALAPASPGFEDRPSAIAAEFATAFFGFPGFGWLMCRRTRVGVLLLSVVPASVWGMIPVLAIALRHNRVLSVPGVFRALPALAILSAGGLAIAQWRTRRHRLRTEAVAQSIE